MRLPIKSLIVGRRCHRVMALGGNHLDSTHSTHSTRQKDQLSHCAGGLLLPLLPQLLDLVQTATTQIPVADGELQVQAIGGHRY